jgi:nitrite reductase (NADH) large subunit
MSAVIQQSGGPEEYAKQQSAVEHSEEAIVVVGAGPVGMHFVEELLARGVDQPIVVYGGEPWKPYDRVRLSAYLAGDVFRDELLIEPKEHESTKIEYRYNCKIEWVDRFQKLVVDADGGVQKYSKLILAVGSSPFIPFFGNSNYSGVYTFRTLAEADALLARKTRSSHTVIIGGGLLGLETARAMQQYNTHITVVEHNRWLMLQQLDEQGAKYLQEYVESTGIDVVLGDGIVSVVGSGRVEAVTLKSGKELVCDTLIIAAGIRSNLQLATDIGLVCGKGIRVNDYLETNDEDIYAIGECAEHDNAVYGLVKPGLEQASVLADRLTGGWSRYLGSLDSARLKVMNQSVFSSGQTGIYEESRTTVQEYVYAVKEEGIYRKIRVFGNKIVGVIAVGDWHESALIQEAIQEKRKLWFWNIIRFKTSGNIWGDAEDMDVNAWPSSAIVCNCTGVTHGRLSSAIDNGCDTVACLKSITRASSVCGSCKPLIEEMLGNDAKADAVRSWRGLLAMSALTLSLTALFIFVWRVPYADTVQHAIRWDMLWRDSLFKQITGFTVLGLLGIGLLLSLRKRVTKINVGDYSLWRMAHVVLGIGALLALVAHTGFRLGSEMNLLLMLNFLLLAAAGANASTVVATEHRMIPGIAKKQRKRWTWLHLLLFWPLPVLLGFHIAKTYYF